MELLANYQTSEPVFSVDSNTLADLLSKASRGRFGLDKANQIQQYAKNSSGVILASSGLSLIIKQYIEQLKSFESCIEIFDAEIEKIYDTFNCQLHTITGIGKTLAAVIFSEIVGKKFDTVPKLVAFTGFILKIDSRANLNVMGQTYLNHFSSSSWQ